MTIMQKGAAGALTSLAALAAGMGSAAAQGPLLAAAPLAAEPSDIIMVEGAYRPAEVTSATKTPTLLVDVPQSVSILSEQQIEDQAFMDIGDVLRFTPGTSIGQGEGHRDQITIRGQNTTADFFIDGLRDDVQYFRPLYNLERIEVLKGANALIFGRGGGGGVINRVTKTPDIGETFGSAEASADSFGAAFVTADQNFATSENTALRLNAFYEHLANHRDVFEGDRFAVNPTFKAQVTPRTALELSYEYVEDDRIVDRGVPSVDGRPVEGFDETFFGSPEANVTDLQAHIARARVEHQISEGWTADAQLLYADYDKVYQNLYPVGFSPAAGTVTLDGYRDETARENFIFQGNLVGKAQTGPLAHTLLVGVEYTDQTTENARRDVLFSSSSDDQVTFAFSDPLVIPAFSFPAFSRDRDSEVSVTSFYLQDQIDIGEKIKLVGGLRYDRFDIDVLDQIERADGPEDGNDGRLGRADEEISPRVGLIYKPIDSASLYASWSRSFLPRAGDQFLTLDLSSQALDPEVFENSEIGVKWDIRPDLSVTAAAFRLERDSGTTIDPSDPERTILISGLTRGVELQVVGRVLPFWVVNAGYSYLDAEEDGRIVAGMPADRELAQVPEHMFSVWNRFEATDRLGLGLGLTHQSGQFATIGNAVELPGFTRVDAAAYYRVNDHLELQLNVENLTDEDYFPAAHNDTNISTGEPLNARLTLRTRF